MTGYTIQVVNASKHHCKPKTIDEINYHQHRASMRCDALRFRELTHPNTVNYNFTHRMQHAASALKMAIFYRDLSRKWGAK